MRLRKEAREIQVEPKLMIPDYLGNHEPEYFPSDVPRFVNRLRFWYLVLRARLGLNIYYWQIRYVYQPKYRKMFDLHFLLHVQSKHNSTPTNLLERFHYKLGMSNYGSEIRFIDYERSGRIAQDENSKHQYAYNQHYFDAYKERWLENPRLENENRVILYHGVSYGDAIDVLKEHVEIIEEHIAHLNRLKAFFKATKKSN